MNADELQRKHLKEVDEALELNAREREKLLTWRQHLTGATTPVTLIKETPAKNEVLFPLSQVERLRNIALDTLKENRVAMKAAQVLTEARSTGDAEFLATITEQDMYMVLYELGKRKPHPNVICPGRGLFQWKGGEGPR